MLLSRPCPIYERVRKGLAHEDSSFWGSVDCAEHDVSGVELGSGSRRLSDVSSASAHFVEHPLSRVFARPCDMDWAYIYIFPLLKKALASLFKRLISSFEINYLDDFFEFFCVDQKILSEIFWHDSLNSCGVGPRALRVKSC